MADITMCTNRLCPEAQNCYRVQATPSVPWQSMTAFAYEVSAGGVVCSNKIPMLNADQTNTTKPI